MKAYFTASIVGKNQYLPLYEKIVDILKNKGIELIADHILSTSPSQIRLESREDRIDFQDKLDRWITSCDFMVAETSFPSISVGFEISLALHRGKPVLILYSEGHPPSLLAHHKDEKLICEHYTAETLDDIISDFINYVRGAADSRFTFFITSEIAGYLDAKAKEHKLPKSVYLRKLIEKDMKKNN